MKTIELFGNKSAAEFLNVKQRTLRHKVATGKITPRYKVRDTGGYLFTESDLKKIQKTLEK